MLSKTFIDTLTARTKVVEQTTDAEVVTVLARASDGYYYIPTLWAALLALLTPLLLHYLDFWFEWYDVLLTQWLVWLALSLLFQWSPIKMRLIPRNVLRTRAARYARLQFLEQGLHRTPDRLGVLLFVSLAERYVEILTDDGVARRIDNVVWQDMVGSFVQRVRRGELEPGLLASLDAIGEKLAATFPPTHQDNHLPDAPVVLAEP